MNKNIINLLLCGAVTLGLASCDENSYNNDYLDGFEEGPAYNQILTDFTYTFSATDYDGVAKALLASGICQTKADSAVANAIASNRFIDNSSIYTSDVALPIYFASRYFPYYLSDNGSTMDVVFNEASETNPELALIAGADNYTVTTADYQSVWGSETDFIEGFAPMVPASAKIAGILASRFPSAEEGQYVIVTYQQAQENPVFGANEAPQYTAVLYAAGADADTYYAALPISKETAYSYLSAASVEVVNGVPVNYTPEMVWTFTETNGGYFVNDANGTYIYGSNRYNNFYWADSPATGDDTYVFTVEEADGGNTLNCAGSAGRWMQYATNYNNFGEYTYQSGNNAHVYFIDGPASKSGRGRSVLNAPVTTTVNTMYYFDGSSWSAPAEVTVLNPSDYTAMGFSNNALEDAEIYLPKYMGSLYPYAQNGDQQFVVYNIERDGASVSLMVNNGAGWTINDNGEEQVTARFTKADGRWSFVKYMGKSIFHLFTEPTIAMGQRYLIVAEGICAIPFTSTRNPYYSYLYTASITDNKGTITAESDFNAFMFTDTYGDITLENGEFFIIDSYGQMIYMNNDSYNTFYKDDAVSPSYEGCRWKAELNDDGTWTITNTYNEHWIQYSTRYGSYGCYSTVSGVLPTLYMLDAPADVPEGE